MKEEGLWKIVTFLMLITGGIVVIIWYPVASLLLFGGESFLVLEIGKETAFLLLKIGGSAMAIAIILIFISLFPSLLEGGRKQSQKQNQTQTQFDPR